MGVGYSLEDTCSGEVLVKGGLDLVDKLPVVGNLLERGQDLNLS